jgi:hypothetical protein
MCKSVCLLIPYAILFLLGMASCTNTVRLRVMRPAVIDVSKDIQTLGTANRYKPEKPNRVLNVLEGLLSGEGIGTDRRGAEASLEGLGQVMRESPRFKTTQLAVELQGTGMANFPTPLAADEVKRLCQLANSDALVTIEAFDSDSKLDYGTKTKKEKVGDQTQDVVYHTVNAGIRVTVGWRMYRASDGTIIDEYRMNKTVNFSREGHTRAEATSKLPNKESMTQEIGRVTGNAYASRISPAWFWVNREFYSSAKKTPEMKVARNSTRVSDWEGAARIWKGLTSNSNPKVARKAMYNMAVACEVMGDLESALSWTEQSYKMGLNNALSYNQILRNRIFEQKRLENQLEKPEPGGEGGK